MRHVSQLKALCLSRTQKSNGRSGTVDLTTSTNGTTQATAVTLSQSFWELHETAVHGWVSAVGVGLLMPLTMIIARNFKVC